MADSGARRTRIAWLVAGFLVLVVAIAVASPRAALDQDLDPRMSTYLATDAGARGLYLALDELGVPVARHRLAPSQLPQGGTLVLLRPSISPDSTAVARLRAWTEEGGTLVLVPHPEGASLLERLDVGLATAGLDDPTTARASQDPPHSWLADVEEVPGVTRVWSRVPENATPLLATDAGDPLLLRIPLGEGGIVAWSDAALLRNEALKEDPQPAFPLVRAAAEHAPVRFDEFHHGFSGEGSPARTLGTFLTTTGWGQWTLQGALAALLLLLLAGHRFGRPRPIPQVRGRSPLEHADALAAVYQKASAHRTARRLLLAGLHRSLGQRPTPELVLPATLQGTPAARRLAREWERGDDADLEALSGAMDDFLSEARG
ncbi:MAG: DUF4350 domain-containing protein [Gemmatimonadales bacterium]|nr:MAG: DUF4350 domain-containing protein [Gemmatimonadales bacterium]